MRLQQRQERAEATKPTMAKCRPPRQVELLVEDSANDVCTDVQKARMLIERDQVNFMIGDVNSGIAAAIGQVTAEKKILHMKYALVPWRRKR